jgi:hypothetical protein
MPYAQLLLKHGPLKQAEMSDDALNEQFYANLETLKGLDPAFAKVMTEWASRKLPKKNSAQEKDLLALMADPIYGERIKFERIIAHEFMQLLIQMHQAPNKADPKFKIQALKIYATYRLYASKDIERNKYDLNPDIDIIVDNVMKQFNLKYEQLNAGFSPVSKFLNAFGRITDKLIKQRVDEQGVKDIKYALHFLSLIMILEIKDNSKTLPFFNKWRDDSPVSFTNGYSMSIHDMEIKNIRQHTLIVCYHIVKNLLLEHTLVKNPSSMHNADIKKLIQDWAKYYLKDPNISTMQDFVNKIGEKIPEINNSSATVTMTATSANNSSSSSSSRRANHRTNNNNLPVLSPDTTALLLYHGPGFAVNNVAMAADAAGQAIGAVADVGGLDLGGCAMSIM